MLDSEDDNEDEDDESFESATQDHGSHGGAGDHDAGDHEEAEDHSPLVGPVLAYRLRVLPYALFSVVDNSNGDGVTLKMNIDGTGRCMRIRCDSSGVAISIYRLLAFGFEETISASTDEYKDAMKELGLLATPRYLTGDARVKCKFTPITFPNPTDIS